MADESNTKDLFVETDLSDQFLDKSGEEIMVNNTEQEQIKTDDSKKEYVAILDDSVRIISKKFISKAFSWVLGVIAAAGGGGSYYFWNQNADLLTRIQQLEQNQSAHKSRV
ncbi:MAG: hypothetical protein HC836_44910 [Richelia sp. RM2_1_2]|nr:hypothetical protein [Richelia sp. RM2_1_2]